MKAPDKIYLEKSLSYPDRLHSQWYPYDVIGGGIEYIRKDALLEWANQYITAINKEPNADGYAGRAAKAVLTDLIKKLNSM